MDGDRFRASQPSSRRVVNGSSEGRSAGGYRREEEEERHAPIAEPREDMRPSEAPVRPAPARAHRPWPLIILLLVVILGVVGWFAWSQLKSEDTGIKSDKYQALFLSNGQIYFGKLTVMSDTYFKLTDVFYLEKAAQSEDSTETVTTQPVQASLRKLGVKDVHGPEDAMFVSRDQVLMYENLTDDGQVVKAIDQYKQQAQQ